MTAIALRQLGYGHYLNQNVEYGIGTIRKPGTQGTSPEDYYGYYQEAPSQEDQGQNNAVYVTKHFQFIRSQGSNDWRQATLPKKIRGQMWQLFFSNVVVAMANIPIRLVQLVFELGMIFFNTFSEIYPPNNDKPFSSKYIESLHRSYHSQCQSIKEILKRFWIEMQCFGVMQIATLHAILNPEDSHKMEFLFGDQEFKMNQEIPFKGTSSFGWTRGLGLAYKLYSPGIWGLMIQECRPDQKALKAFFVKQIPQTASSDDPIRDVQCALKDNVYIILHADEKEILQTLLDQKPYKEMETKELLHLKQLKRDFLLAVFAKTPKQGFVQARCLYPNGTEKQNRIKVYDGTVSTTLEAAWREYSEMAKSVIK